MVKKQSQLKPGDEVCTIEDIIEYDWRWEPYVKIDKGRLGTVISFKEYWADFEKSHTPPWESPNRLRTTFYSDWNNGVKDGFLCPVRFYWLTYEGTQSVFTQGQADLVGKKSLAKLDFLEKSIVFILERVRVIFAEGDHPQQPDWGQKALVLDFMFENRGMEAIAIASSLKMWLSYCNPGDSSLGVNKVIPIHMTLSTDDLEVHTRLFGEAVFHVPGDTGSLDFHLELPNLGVVDKTFQFSTLQPGDRVRLKRSTRKVSVDVGPSHKKLYTWLTKDTIGTIVSLSQYREYLRGVSEIKPEDEENFDRYCGFIKQRIEVPGWFSNEDHAYLVRLDEVNRSPDEPYPNAEEYTRWVMKEYPNRQEPPVDEGEIVTVTASDLEKIK
jgi:hypothetical protein